MQKSKKEEIIKAAERRFIKHGPGKTTLDEIARDLRIGKSSLYHYFSSKDELFIEVLRWRIQRYIEHIEEIFNNEEISMQDRFRNYLQLKLELKQNYKLIYRLLVSDLLKQSSPEEEELIKYLLEREENIMKLVANVIFSDSVEATDARTSLFITMLTFMPMLINQLFISKLEVTELDMTDKLLKNFEQFLFVGSPAGKSDSLPLL